MTNEEREEEILRRSSRASQEIGSGGEGHIGWDQECFICGSIGHWGYDCLDRFPDPAVRDPPAFSSFNANTGPFPEDTIDRHNGMRVTAAIRHFERASKKRREDTATSTTFADGYGFSGEANVGKRGREKAQREARETAHKRQLEEEDEPDWFTEHNTTRRRYAGPSNGASGARRVGAMVMGAQRNVGSLKLSPLRRNRSRVGSQTSSRYPSRKLGRNGRNRNSCGISRIRVANFALIIRSSSVQTARPIDIAGETTSQSAAEILSMKVPEVDVTSRTKARLPAPHQFLSKARRAPRGAREMPNHEIEAQTVDWKEQERASWNRDQREERSHDLDPSTNGHPPNGRRNQSSGRSSSGFVNGPRYRGGYGV
ncbi:hypothetical protein BS47DRAFT_1153045 [Hydnum rufescens UP504]|uniref:CCHC-type domain-containing protein n=1 Tax=Hydnum rufescens UP504 TaxID=1448309 RepID=A0A9P6B940_9AGAM|nr:hypothetical protein BS47DRAFT_1153045 [Hydnum rufescens UP504]